MKQVLKNTAAALLVSLITLSFSSVAMASDGGKQLSGIDLKFVGHVKDQPVFQLRLSNESADEFYITIKDLNGNTLYSDNVKGSNIVRNFAINTEEIGDNTLRLEVWSKNNRKRETYTISKTEQYVVEADTARK
jgi:hypothetical protein